MFVPADVDLADLAVARIRWWMRAPVVRLWRRIIAQERIRNYAEARMRIDTLLQKYGRKKTLGLLCYLRWRETGSVYVAERDVKRYWAKRVSPRKEVLRPELRKWRILLVKSTGHELHKIAEDLKRRGFPTYELRKVLPE